jgi:hypothetical protein
VKRLVALTLRACASVLLCFALVNGTLFSTRADDANVHYSDLQHLQLTATGALPVTLIYPKNGSAASGPATQITAQTVNGAGVEIAVNGTIVPARNLGRMAVSKTGTTVFDYYGVLLHPGPNTVVATALGASGIRGQSQTATVYGPGPAVSINVSMLGTLVADGKSQASLLVDARDQWNNPAMEGSLVDVTVLSGKATIGASNNAISEPSPQPSGLPIQASSQPRAHFELPTGGRIQIPIVAALEPGTLQVRVAIGAMSETQAFTIAPYLRAPLVNGLVTAGAGSVPAAVDGDGRYDAGGARKERIAIFASGKVGKASSLTVAYESQNRLQQSSSLGPYTVDPNERPYQTYGDSSAVTSNFHSGTRLYARLDNGRNSAMLGQYDAIVGAPQGVAHYQQQLSGAQAQIALGGAGQGRIVGFTARDPVAFVSFSVPVTGLGALLQPLHPDIVLGSDILTLVALDRRSGAVISQTPLTRNVDYTIDYATGTVRFLNIPLPYDAHFDPQVLQVQYQYQGAGVSSETSGFDFNYALLRNGAMNVNLGYLNNSSGTANYSLATQTVAGHSPGGTWQFSHASSGGVVPSVGSTDAVQSSNRGSATSFAVTQRIAGSQVAFNYENVGPGFANPFGGFTVTGLENMNASLVHQWRNGSSFNASLAQQRNIGTAASVQQTFVAAWRQMVTSALTVTLGLQTQHENNAPQPVPSGQPVPAGISGSGGQLQAGLLWKPQKRVAVGFEHQASLGGNSQVLPSQTTVEFDYEFPQRGKIFLRELFGGAVPSFAQATQSYTAPSIGSRSTQIGLERTIGNTTVDTSYDIADTGNGLNIYSALGLQEIFKFGKRLSGNASMQSAHGIGANADGFTVFGTGITYSNLKDFRASFSMQTRGGYGGGTTMNGGAAGHIGPNIAMLGSFNETFAAGVQAVNDRISLAYRPSQNDRFISLLALDRASGGYTYADSTADVLSFEEIFRATPSTEIVGRLGYKLNGDGYYLAHSSVAGLRITQTLSPRFDFGAEAREMAAGNIAGARATDFATELGYRIGSGTRLAAGYNFSGSVDPTLTGHPQRRGFYVTVTTLIDRVFGWGKQ